MKSLHISINCPLELQTKQFHVIINLFFSSLPIPPLTSHPCHLHLSSGRCKSSTLLRSRLPKPPQSAMPHHICHTLYTQKNVLFITAFYPSTTLRTSISPSFALSSLVFSDSPPSSPTFPYVFNTIIIIYLFIYFIYLFRNKHYTINVQ